ncbi:hypothetical protein Ac2012v2_006643 [Leucoagaricus gongylophorus]
MGVSGLTQYLQKTCPHIIHRLPERLKEIAGKRIVIDGTLITQRLHYAPSPHPSRHVLGWYHLAREINKSGVSAVCIFDGQKRSIAKAEETRRRQESQRLQVSRGHVEILRTKRLQTIKSLVSDVHSLGEEGKSRVAEMLSGLNSPDAGVVGAVEGLDSVEEHFRTLDDSPVSTKIASERISSGKSPGGEIPPFALIPSEVVSPTKLPSAEPPTQMVHPFPQTLGHAAPTEPTVNEILHPVELPTQEVLQSPQTLSEETPPSAELPSKESLLPVGPPTQEAPHSPQTLGEVVPPVEPPMKETPPAEPLTKEIPPLAEPPTKEIPPLAGPPMKEMPPADLPMKEIPPLAKHPTKDIDIPPSAGPPMKEVPPLAEHPPTKDIDIPPPAEPITKEIPPLAGPPMKEVPPAELPTKEIPPLAEHPTKDIDIPPPAEPPMKELPPAEPLTNETHAATESPNVKIPLIGSSSLPPLNQKVIVGDEHAPELVCPALQLPQDSIFVSSGNTKSDIPVPSISSVEELIAALLSSYQDFRSSILKVASFPMPRGKVKPIFPSVDELGTQEDDDLVLSRMQCELTLEEGRVWKELTLATMPPNPTTATEDDLAVPNTPTPSYTITHITPSPTTTPVMPSLTSTPVMPLPTTAPLAPSPPTTILSPSMKTSPTPSPLTTTFTTPTTATTTAMTPTSLPAPESCDFVIDQSLLRAAEERLDALRIKSKVVTESYQRRMDPPTKNTYMESRKILEAMGVLCYEVEGAYEGEALASSLVLQGLADYVVSEDSDVLVYGAPLIRNLSSRGEPLVLIDGNDVPGVLGLSEDAYIDFALLLGTDFTKRIKNVGPHRAHKFIQTYGTIERIIDGQSKYQPTSRTDYLAQVDAARAVFSTLVPVPDRLAVSMMPNEFEFGVVDQAKINVIMERCGLGKELMMGAYWESEAALAGNYFDDDPRSVTPNDI